MEAQISHATRKKANSTKLKEQVTGDVERKQEKITSYHRDLEIVRREADRVQGEFFFFDPSNHFPTGCQRNSAGPRRAVPR